MTKFYLSIFFVHFFFASYYAQGQIFNKEEADHLFGPVLFSVSMSNADLNSLADLSGGIMMFRLNSGCLTVLGSKRIILYPSYAVVTSTDEFKVFNSNLVKKVTSEGGSFETKIELRGNEIISLTNGNLTLEFGPLCPPYCP